MTINTNCFHANELVNVDKLLTIHKTATQLGYDSNALHIVEGIEYWKACTKWVPQIQLTLDLKDWSLEIQLKCDRKMYRSTVTT